VDSFVWCSGCDGGLTVWLDCTLSVGVVGRCLGGTVGGGIGVGIISQRGSWRVGGFFGGILAGMMVGGALGVQLLVTTVEWVVIECMVLMDQWHLFDGIGFLDVVR
jgi:hypothetical protein